MARGGPIKTSIILQGTAKWRRRTLLLPTKIADKAERAGLRAGGSGLLTAARRRVPRRFGFLRESMLTKYGLKVYKKTGTDTWIAVVGPGKFKEAATDPFGDPVDPRKYAHLVEFGVTAHPIAPKNAKALAFGGTALSDASSGGVLATGLSRVLASSVAHPGFRGRPFLRPAWDENRSKILERMGKAMWRTMRRELAKS